jgi:predicted RND superfamily exporter protein
MPMDIQSQLERFASGVVHHRWWILALLASLTALFALQIPDLRTDFTPSDLFATFEDQKEVDARFQSTYGTTDHTLLVLVLADDVTRRKPLGYVQDVSRGLSGVESIARVESITTTRIPRVRSESGVDSTDEQGAETEDETARAFSTADILQRFGSGAVRVDPIVEGETVETGEARKLRRALQDAPLLEGRLFSEDRTLAAVTLFLSDDVTQTADVEAAVHRVESWVGTHPPPESVDVRLAGLPYVRTQVVEKMRADQTVMLPAAILVSLLMLFVAFRWWPAVVLPLVAVGTSGATVVGAMAWFGEPFNIINNIVPLLIVVIGITDAIHLIHRYGEEFEAERDREAGSRRALTYMAVACFLTSFTTAAGFASLAVSNTEILQRFGITAALGIICVYLVTVTFIPAMLPAVPKPTRLARETSEGWIEELIESITRTLSRRSGLVLAASGVVTVAAIGGASTLRADNAVLDQLDEEDPVYKTTKLIEEKLYGVRPLEVSFRSDQKTRFLDPAFLNELDRLEAWARRQPGVIQTFSPNDYLHEAWYLMTGESSVRREAFPSREMTTSLADLYAQAPGSPLQRYMTADGSGARLSIQLEDVGAQATLRFVERLRSQIETRFGEMEDVHVRFTGDAYVASQGLDIVIRDLLWSLATAFVIIFGFLGLVLRDWRLALLSVPPNVLPLLLTMGYMSMRRIPLNTATAVIFSIAIGLAVDGTIHLLVRFQEEVERQDDLELALVRSARGTGKAIALTYLSLMLGFGVMLFSSFVPVRRFGELISVTVCGCLISTILVLPPLLRLGWREDEVESS